MWQTREVVSRVNSCSMLVKQNDLQAGVTMHFYELNLFNTV